MSVGLGAGDLISSNAIQTPSTSSDNLGKDAFLKLLILQMKNQDPMNPTDNEQMLAQLAQFSSLEQMSNLNKNLETSNLQTAFVQATSLLGKKVEVLQPGATDASNGVLESTVKSVSYTDKGPQLTLENNLIVKVDEIVNVKE